MISYDKRRRKQTAQIKISSLASQSELIDCYMAYDIPEFYQRMVMDYLKKISFEEIQTFMQMEIKEISSNKSLIQSYMKKGLEKYNVENYLRMILKMKIKSREQKINIEKVCGHILQLRKINFDVTYYLCRIRQKYELGVGVTSEGQKHFYCDFAVKLNNFTQELLRSQFSQYYEMEHEYDPFFLFLKPKEKIKNDRTSMEKLTLINVDDSYNFLKLEKILEGWICGEHGQGIDRERQKYKSKSKSSERTSFPEIRSSPQKVPNRNYENLVIRSPEIEEQRQKAEDSSSDFNKTKYNNKGFTPQVRKNQMKNEMKYQSHKLQKQKINQNDQAKSEQKLNGDKQKKSIIEESPIFKLGKIVRRNKLRSMTEETSQLSSDSIPLKLNQQSKSYSIRRATNEGTTPQKKYNLIQVLERNREKLNSGRIKERFVYHDERKVVLPKIQRNLINIQIMPFKIPKKRDNSEENLDEKDENKEYIRPKADYEQILREEKKKIEQYLQARNELSFKNNASRSQGQYSPQNTAERGDTKRYDEEKKHQKQKDERTRIGANVHPRSRTEMNEDRPVEFEQQKRKYPDESGVYQPSKIEYEEKRQTRQQIQALDNQQRKFLEEREMKKDETSTRPVRYKDESQFNERSGKGYSEYQDKKPQQGYQNQNFSSKANNEGKQNIIERPLETIKTFGKDVQLKQILKIRDSPSSENFESSERENKRDAFHDHHKYPQNSQGEREKKQSNFPRKENGSEYSRGDEKNIRYENEKKYENENMRKSALNLPETYNKEKNSSINYSRNRQQNEQKSKNHENNGYRAEEIKKNPERKHELKSMETEDDYMRRHTDKYAESCNDVKYYQRDAEQRSRGRPQNFRERAENEDDDMRRNAEKHPESYNDGKYYQRDTEQRSRGRPQNFRERADIRAENENEDQNSNTIRIGEKYDRNNVKGNNFSFLKENSRADHQRNSQKIEEVKSSYERKQENYNNRRNTSQKSSRNAENKKRSNEPWEQNQSQFLQKPSNTWQKDENERQHAKKYQYEQRKQQMLSVPSAEQRMKENEKEKYQIPNNKNENRSDHAESFDKQINKSESKLRKKDNLNVRYNKSENKNFDQKGPLNNPATIVYQGKQKQQFSEKDDKNVKRNNDSYLPQGQNGKDERDPKISSPTQAATSKKMKSTQYQNNQHSSNNEDERIPRHPENLERHSSAKKEESKYFSKGEEKSQQNRASKTGTRSKENIEVGYDENKRRGSIKKQQQQVEVKSDRKSYNSSSFKAKKYDEGRQGSPKVDKAESYEKDRGNDKNRREKTSRSIKGAQNTPRRKRQMEDESKIQKEKTEKLQASRSEKGSIHSKSDLKNKSKTKDDPFKQVEKTEKISKEGSQKAEERRKYEEAQRTKKDEDKKSQTTRKHEEKPQEKQQDQPNLIQKKIEGEKTPRSIKGVESKSVEKKEQQGQREKSVKKSESVDKKVKNTQTVNRTNISQSQSRISQKVKTPITMKVGKFSFEAFKKYIQNYEFNPDYLSQYNISKVINQTQYQQTYFIQFVIGNNPGVVVLSSITQNNNFVTRFWAISKFCEAKYALPIFKKYGIFLEKYIPNDQFYYRGYQFPEVLKAGFQLKGNAGTIYVRKRGMKAKEKQMVVQSFLTIQCTQLAVDQQNENQVFFASSEIQPFSVQNSKMSPLIFEMSKSNLPSQFSQVVQITNNIQNFKNLNLILSEQDLDTYAISPKLQAKSIDLSVVNLNMPFKELFVANDGKFKFYGNIVTKTNNKIICSIKLSQNGGRMLFGKGFSSIESFDNMIGKDSQEKIQFIVPMFGKQLYGLYKHQKQTSKNVYGNWNITLFWQDQLQGVIKHNFSDHFNFGQQFHVAIQFHNQIIYSFLVNKDDCIAV